MQLDGSLKLSDGDYGIEVGLTKSLLQKQLKKCKTHPHENKVRGKGI